MRRALTLREERFAYRAPFRIAGHLFTETAVLVAEIGAGDHVGLGEGSGVYYLGDDLAHMREAAERVRPRLEAGGRPGGGARPPPPPGGPPAAAWGAGGGRSPAARRSGGGGGGGGRVGAAAAA